MTTKSAIHDMKRTVGNDQNQTFIKHEYKQTVTMHEQNRTVTLYDSSHTVTKSEYTIITRLQCMNIRKLHGYNA